MKLFNRYKIKFFLKLIYSNLQTKEKKSGNKSVLKIKKIAIIYFIPKDSPRLNTWNDGFVAAVNLLEQDYSITWVNIDTKVLTENFLNSFDFLLVKSNWNWGPDELLRSKFRNLKVKKGLAVAGVSIPPRHKDTLYYDVLWYETNWYKRILKNHPNIHHAFGINKKDLKVRKPNLKYDYISIGAFLPHKRMHLLHKLEGKILVIGENYDSNYSKELVSKLSKNENITLLPFVEYSKLPEYFSQANTLYIPANVNGGGERAILEARHCGLDVKIENDNNKLKEISNCVIWDEEYYYKQLEIGIKSLTDN